MKGFYRPADRTFASEFTLGSQFVDGSYHYSKAYYKNFIKMANMDNYNLRQSRRSRFIPSDKVEKKNFEQRFNIYMHKLQVEDAAKKQKELVEQAVQSANSIVDQVLG